MNDEEESTEKPLIPLVKLTWETQISPTCVVVVPSTIASFVEKAPTTTVGIITVRYAQLDRSTDQDVLDDDFDENEQLYSVLNMQALLRKYPNVDIPVYHVTDTKTLAVVVPRFTNVYVEKLLAKKIALLGDEQTQWLTLAPCQINNNLSICRLDTSPENFKEVPLLQPPHVVTGISAALISEMAKSKGDLTKVFALVLNSEGQPGFEKVDADALMDAAEKGACMLVGKDRKVAYLKALSLSVRKISSADSYAMYI